MVEVLHQVVAPAVVLVVCTVPVDVSVGNYTVQCGAGSAGATQQNSATSNGGPSGITSALGVIIVEAKAVEEEQNHHTHIY